MNYATGYGIKPSEMFIKFNPKKLGLSKKDFKDLKIGVKPKQFAARVFIYGYQLILNDIIKNKVIFSLPSTKESYIEMNKVSGDEFKLARQKGAFKDVDLIQSRFTGNSLIFRFQKKTGWGFKPIYVHHKLKDIITKNTNNRFY